MPDSQNIEFNKISLGVGSDAHKARWENYELNVKALLNGGNSYDSLRGAMARLGFTTTGQNGYEQRFGLMLRPPAAPEPILAPARLMAETVGEVMLETPDGPDLTPTQEAALLARAEPLFAELLQSPEMENAMWIPDLPWGAGALIGSAVAVTTVLPAEAADGYALGRCTVAKPSLGAAINPTVAAGSYLFDYHGNDPRYKEKLEIGQFFSGANATLIKAPKHGKVVYSDLPHATEWQYYHYWPTEGYVGNDRFVMQVEKDGVKVRIHYLIKVLEEYEAESGMCKPEQWKISYAPAALTDPAAALLPSALRSLVGFADLPGSSVGETTNTGPTAQITLDVNAAGHGWYIDYTPYLNEEFLPTSNPNEWVAKPGSEAEGKMDMLTVLLHEYGHALGLDHSADGHDFMAATLQPGVRRTLTVDEQLELMRLAGIFVTPESPSEPYAPTDPGAPLPFTRVVATRSARRAAGLDGRVPQFDTAANPKLSNPEFAGADGWSTTGDVRFANGTATLAEGAATQTRLNQVFVVNEGDRFLSFTVANAALGDQADGPDDAFEVALLDANTGLSLLGGTGLTKNDAILNRQANGAEVKASGINVVVNADGSRTYLVDLAGLNKTPAAGTAVNLSFDLIGFGKGLEAQNSRLTIRDLRLGVPQTQDDTATTTEDTPMAIDALANDLNARQPGFAPVLAAGSGPRKLAY